MEKINAKTQRTQQENHRVAHFFELRINELKKSGHPRTAEIYLSSYRSFARFLTESAATDNSKTQSLSPSDIDFSQIDAHLIKCYEQYLLQQRKLCMNTVSFYLRTLRAVCNAATESGLDGCPRPFRHVYTGIAPTEKRAIPIHAIRQLKTLDFHGKPSHERARDFFLFSFYTRGMPFVDMAYLKKSNLRNNILQYKRKKTGQALSIGWEECMQDILDKHPASPDSPYLLPIIQEKGMPRSDKKTWNSSDLKMWSGLIFSLKILESNWNDDTLLSIAKTSIWEYIRCKNLKFTNPLCVISVSLMLKNWNTRTMTM